MSASKTTIRNKALKKLGVLADGQTATAEQSASVEAAYDEVYARLDHIGLVVWSSTEEVPDQYIAPIVALVAMERAEDYSIPDSRFQRLAVQAARAEMEIRRIMSGRWMNPTEVEDF